MVFTEQQLQVKKLVDVQQDIEIDALNDGVGALSTSMQNGFTEASNNFNDIQNSLAVMNGLSESRYNTLYDSVNILSNDMSNIASGLGDAISNVASDMINMNNGIQNQFNQVNTNIGDSINNFHNEISNDLYVNVFSADTMIYNVSATPVNSLTALGYDSNGKIIPVTVIANSNIQFPTSADYLYTDVAGTAFGGTADTEVNTNNNLITSYAVYNAVSDIWTDLNEFHNEVSNSFGSVQNSFNAVDSTLAGVQNQFNDVNNAHNALYQNVVDGFIDVWGNFDKVNNSITNMNSNIQGQFNDVSNQFNGVSNNFNNVGNKFSEIGASTSDVVDSLVVNLFPVNEYNSTSPINYQDVTEIAFSDSLTSGTDVGNIKMSYIGTRLKIKPVLKFSKYIFNINANGTFAECHNLNQNIQFPCGINKMYQTFLNCYNLNQNIRIPNKVSQLFQVFRNCTSLNQNISIPDNAVSAVAVFSGCTSLNQNIQIGKNIIQFMQVFDNCTSLNQNIYIPDTSLSDNMVSFANIFRNCVSLNQNIHIPKYIGNSVTTYPNDYTGFFNGCSNLNQSIFMDFSNQRNVNLSNFFKDCSNLNKDIYLKGGEFANICNMFYGCSKLLSHNIHISSNIPLNTQESYLYEALTNNYSGVNWSGRVYNDL